MTSNSSQRFGPPRKRITNLSEEANIASLQSEVLMHSNPSSDLRPDSGSQYLPDLVIDYVTYHSCPTHGDLNTNLCAQCIAELAGFSPVVEPRGVLIAAMHIFYVKVLEPFFKLLWLAIKFLYFVITSCFVCFALMWFVQHPMSPQQRRRNELNDQWRKRRDDEWRARSDADHERRKSEQESWESDRDREYERKKSEQEKWEKQRDADYEKRVEEQIAWEKQRDEDYRKAQKEAYEAARTAREEDEKRKGEAIKEAQALAEKIASSQIDPENDLVKLEDLGQELKTLSPSHANDALIEKIKTEAIDSHMEEATQSFASAVSIIDDFYSRDTSSGSREQVFEKEVDNIERKLDDADKIRKRTKK